MIGDPSGRSTERAHLANDNLQHNLAAIRKQIERVFDNHRHLFWNKQKSAIELKDVRCVSGLSFK